MHDLPRRVACYGVDEDEFRGAGEKVGDFEQVSFERVQQHSQVIAACFAENSENLKAGCVVAGQAAADSHDR